MTDIVDIYVGSDSKEVVAITCYRRSILEKSSVAVEDHADLPAHSIRRLRVNATLLVRKPSFSFSRFLTPYLGCRAGDGACSWIATCLRARILPSFWALRDERYSVMCVEAMITSRGRNEVSRPGAD